MSARLRKLDGILCSGCRAILATPSEVSPPEGADETGACWCAEHAPIARPTRTLRAVDGRVLGLVDLLSRDIVPRLLSLEELRQRGDESGLYLAGVLHALSSMGERYPALVEIVLHEAQAVNDALTEPVKDPRPYWRS